MPRKVDFKVQLIAWAATAQVEQVVETADTLREIARHRGGLKKVGRKAKAQAQPSLGLTRLDKQLQELAT